MHSGEKIAHSLGFELEWLEYEFGGGFINRTTWGDTMMIAHTLDERSGTKSLGTQTLMAFGFDLKEKSHVDPKRGILTYPLHDVLVYNGMDSKWTHKLKHTKWPAIESNPKYLLEYHRKLILAPSMVLTQSRGMPIDFEYSAKLHTKFQADIAAVNAKILRTPEVLLYERKHGPFQPSNDDHVLRLMKLIERPEIKVEERGVVRYTTGEEVLAQMPVEEVPSAPLILEHRGLAKIDSTFIAPTLSRKNVCVDGLIRTRYDSMHAITGRVSADDPAVMNWPKRKYRETRGQVAATEGNVLLPCDYGQIEFRVFGMASEDPKLIEYCWTGYDVHKFWAERMLKLYPKSKDYIAKAWASDLAKVRKALGDEDAAILKIWRQEAKNGWVFPQFFGASPYSCGEQLHLPDDVVEDLAGEFWDTFKYVKRWQEKLVKSYEKNFYVETLSGRRRRGIMNRNMILNHPIQGTALDIATAAWNALTLRSQLEENPEYQPIFFGHDDLTFHVGEDNVAAMVPVIAREMCMHRFDYINVPLVVEVSAGYRWSDTKELKVYRAHELFDLKNPFA